MSLQRVNKYFSTQLSRKDALLVLWCMVASFGAYFSMYAFRKPFNAGVYEGLTFSEWDYKSVLIIAQVFGYMLSKFIGIKVISELKAGKRVVMLLVLVGIAEAALLLFGTIPHPYNFLALFLNGLPLGMIWGIVFSFLEGRRFTEMLAAGLSVSVVMSSGILKTIGRTLIEDFGIPEFWMPVTVGAIFMPLFAFFVWMLSVIPAPTETDKESRVERVPMDGATRRKVFSQYWPGMILLVMCFMILTIARDFRDNFSVEIWNSLGYEGAPEMYAQTEIPIGLVCLVFLGLMVLVKNNLKSMWVVHSMVICGVSTMLISTLLFQGGDLRPDIWMLALGFGLYLAYLPFGTVLYERFIATFRINGNAGFLMYISDSSGYLGSVALLVMKEFFSPEISWLDFFIYLSITASIVVMAGMVLSMIFIKTKHAGKEIGEMKLVLEK